MDYLHQASNMTTTSSTRRRRSLGIIRGVVVVVVFLLHSSMALAMPVPGGSTYLFTIYNEIPETRVSVMCQFQMVDRSAPPSYRLMDLPAHGYVRSYWGPEVFRVFCSIHVARTNCWAHRMLLWGSDQFYAKDEYCKPKYYGGCRLYIMADGHVRERSPYYGSLTRMLMDTPGRRAPRHRADRGAAFGKTCCNSSCCVGWKHFHDFDTEC